jgi:hypothetical protein
MGGATGVKEAADARVYVLRTDPRGGWRVDRQNGPPAVLRGVKKTDLVSRARRLARADGARLLIHRRDGSLEEEWIYSTVGGPAPDTAT